MDGETFSKLIDARFRKCRSVLDTKNKEYTREEDKLYNFKRAAEMLGANPEEALLGMATKHFVSVFDLAKDVDRLDDIEPGYVDEKIGDAINYLLLLEALLVERYGWEVYDE